MLNSFQVISHPYYNSQNFNNDITLLKLSSPVQFNTRVAPVCLASSTTSIPSGTKCVTTGWGRTGSTCEWPTTDGSAHRQECMLVCALWFRKWRVWMHNYCEYFTTWLIFIVLFWVFFIRFQQAHATCSRLPCLCSALISASSTGVITEFQMPWFVLVPLESLPAR